MNECLEHLGAGIRDLEIGEVKKKERDRENQPWCSRLWRKVYLYPRGPQTSVGSDSSRNLFKYAASRALLQRFWLRSAGNLHFKWATWTTHLETLRNKGTPHTAKPLWATWASRLALLRGFTDKFNNRKIASVGLADLGALPSLVEEKAPMSSLCLIGEARR